MGDAGADDRGLSEAEAAERGRAMVAEARAVRRRMLEDAEQRRRALVAELERLRGEIDAAIEALGAVAPAGSGDSTAEAPTDSTIPPGGPARAARAHPQPTPEPVRVGALFDVLRAETPPPSSKPGRAPMAKPAPPRPKRDAVAERDVAPPTDDEPTPAAEAPTDAAAAPSVGVAPEQPTDAVRRRRDALLEPLVPEVVRASKRLLQDEQNSLLDAARRARGRHEPSRLLPEPIRQRETWTALLAPAIDAAYLGGRAAAGKTGRVTSAPTRLVVELAALLVTPLRERVTTTIESVLGEGPYESSNELQRALGSAIGARFREWRTVDLEDHVVDVLAAAHARGAYDAAGPAAMLQWVPAEPGRCPDCDDNALEPTLKGKAFPTGQQHPPAHPGCRCLIVPADA
jgi:hypothetical protein